MRRVEGGFLLGNPLLPGYLFYRTTINRFCAGVGGVVFVVVFVVRGAW